MTQSLHPTAQKGFSLAAELYQKVRPDYPENITYWLQNHLNITQNCTIIDLGSGTGKFLPYLQPLTSHLITVEPISAMLAQLKQRYPDIQAEQAYSDQLPFPHQFANVITCAQSFHWFANIETLQELHRVLKEDGFLILIWNQRDISINWVNAIAHVLEPFEADTPRFHSQTWKHVFQHQNLFKLLHETSFINQHHGSVEQVVLNRLLSTSFIAAMPEAKQLEFKQKFEEIVRDYTQKTAQDEMSFPYITYVYVFQKIPSELG